MARGFNGSTQYLDWDAAHIDETATMSVSVWLYPTTADTTARRAVQFRDASTGFKFIVGESGASGRLYFVTGNSGTAWGGTSGTTLRSAGALSTNTWYHACGSAAGSGASVLSAYLDGVLLTDTTIAGGTGFGPGSDTDRLRVGARTDGNGSTMYAGRAAELCVWSGYQLTASDAATLAAGYTPDVIRPDKIVHYSRLMRTARNLWSPAGVAATETASPAVVEHPRMIPRRRRVSVGVPAAVAPPSGNRRRRVLLCGSR